MNSAAPDRIIILMSTATREARRLHVNPSLEGYCDLKDEDAPPPSMTPPPTYEAVANGDPSNGLADYFSRPADEVSEDEDRLGILSPSARNELLPPPRWANQQECGRAAKLDAVMAAMYTMARYERVESGERMHL